MAGKAEWGSDVIVEMMQRYGIEYAPTNLGATFRGLLDSIINFGENKMPEVIECLHEEIAVSIAHGYARVTGKPAVALVHNVVGTLHATMAIYNAYVDRAPMIIMSGTGPMSLKGRRPWIDWVHTALVQGNLVRDYVKWDDQPHDPESLPESFIRGYRVAMTEPKGPVYIALDAAWQEAKLSEPVTIPDITQYGLPTRMQGDPTSLTRTAELLINADSPLIIADRVGANPEAVKSLVQLAEAGSIPVLDNGGALNFPNNHPLDVTGTDAISQSDVIVLMDVQQVEATLTTFNRYTREIENKVRPGTKIINIGVSDLWIRSTTMDFGRLYPLELSITADTSLAIPQITEDIRTILEQNPGKKDLLAKRQSKTRERSEAAKRRWQAEAEKQFGQKPISLARLAQEAWNVVKGENWILAGDSAGWARRLWQMDRPGSVMAGQAAAALGTTMPKAVGAGLAAKKGGGFCVVFQSDGDLLYVPSSIWTAVHHKIPLLVLLVDNGGYIGEGEHVSWTSEHRGRSTAKKDIATEIKNPRFDFAGLARAQGAYTEGPIEDPSELGAAIRRAFHVMKEDSTFALVWVKMG
jgi:thiamine pyrophosphate-dependent acetolactate synthase large subunit-like protein